MQQGEPLQAALELGLATEWQRWVGDDDLGSAVAAACPQRDAETVKGAVGLVVALRAAAYEATGPAWPVNSYEDFRPVMEHALDQLIADFPSVALTPA